MILKAEYQPSVLRPVPKTSVQPDGMIGEHRAGENSTPAECDSSPRRAAIDTGSPGASQAKTQMEEEILFFETSIDGFLNQNFTSTEQESVVLHQQDVGVDDDKKKTTTTTQQAAVRKEFVSPTEELQQRGTTA